MAVDGLVYTADRVHRVRTAYLKGDLLPIDELEALKSAIAGPKMAAIVGLFLRTVAIEVLNGNLLAEGSLVKDWSACLWKTACIIRLGWTTLSACDLLHDNMLCAGSGMVATLPKCEKRTALRGCTFPTCTILKKIKSFVRLLMVIEWSHP